MKSKSRHSGKWWNSICKGVSKNGSEILAGFGIAGVVVTVIFAVRDTSKAVPLIEEKKKEAAEKNEKLKAAEVVKTTWKCYIPTATAGIFSIGCIIGAQCVSAKRISALAAACKLSETALMDLKDTTEEVVGEEQVKEIKQKIAEKKVGKIDVKDSDKSKVVVASDGDAWFVDPISNQPFSSTVNKIDAAVNRLNRRMRSEMYISLSDLYDEIGGGLQHTSISDELGWRIDKSEIQVEYSDAIVKDGKAYVVMDFLIGPEYDFNKMY